MSYEGRRNNSYFNGNEASPMDEKQVKKQQEQKASEKAFKTAAKGAATYFAGPLGGKAVDALANTKAGQQIINKGGQALNKMPGMGRAAKKLDDSGVTDTVDKGIDIVGGKAGAPGGAPSTPGTTTPGATPGATAPNAQGTSPTGGEKSGLGSLTDKSSSFNDSFNDNTPPGEESDGNSSKGAFSFGGKLTLEQKIMLGVIVGGLLGGLVNYAYKNAVKKIEIDPTKVRTPPTFNVEESLEANIKGSVRQVDMDVSMDKYDVIENNVYNYDHKAPIRLDGPSVTQPPSLPQMPA